MARPLLLVLALAACTGPADDTAGPGDDTAGPVPFQCTMQEQGLEARLVHTDGCADIALHAWTEDGQRLLRIDFEEGLIDEAEAQGGLHRAWSLPDDAVDVTLLEGPCAHERNCDDAIACDDLDVDTFPASRGALSLEVDPEGPTARVELCEVPFDGAPEDAWIGQMTWSAHVGWLPG